MSSSSNIEWTDATWNPIVGCTIVSSGCTNCYAMRDAWRKNFNPATPHYKGLTKQVNGNIVWTGSIARAPDSIFLAPLHWKKPKRIFVNSMGDLFHESIPDSDIDQAFAVMALSPQHTFQVLTKRAERMREYFLKRLFLDVHPLEDRGDAISEAMNAIAPAHWCKRELQDYSEEGLPLPNVWLGVSCERQQEADERIPHLLQTPAAVRFISAEPLLGAIDLMMLKSGDTAIDAVQGCIGRSIGDGEYDGAQPCAKLDWVITGGESGPKARPSHIEWFRSLRDQCSAAGVAYFHKQNGEWLCGTQFTNEHREADPDLEQSKHACMNWDGKEFYRSGGAWCDDLDENAVFRVGKKSAGRLLDGVEHNGMPS